MPEVACIRAGKTAVYYGMRSHAGGREEVMGARKRSGFVGSVGALSNISGVYISQSLSRFDPFGNFKTTPATNPASTNQGYTGHRHNNTGPYDLGLIYMNARYYVPEVGRFASPDTIVPDPGNPQSFNRYSYTNNDPINYTDPSGHCIVAYSGDVRMDEGPYGTSGLCPNTESVIAEGTAAIDAIHNDPDFATPTEDLLLYYIGGPLVLLGAPAVIQAIPLIFPALASGGSAACADGDCTNEIQTVQTGTHTVYQYVENGAVKYIGITNNFFRRAAEHLLQKGWDIQPIEGLSHLSRADARAVEQVLIEYYKLPNLYNSINSIAITNPGYERAIIRGQEILRQIGIMIE